MKTTNRIKTGSIALLMLFTTVASQAKNTGSNSEIENINKQLNEQLAFPKNLKKDEFKESATLIFKLDAYGKVHLQEVKTSNEALRKFVEAQFESISINTSKEYLNRTFSVDVNYRVI